MPVFVGRTGSAALRITGGLDCCSFRYVAVVSAEVSEETLDAPFRRTVEFSYATVASREFAAYYWW